MVHGSVPYKDDVGNGTHSHFGIVVIWNHPGPWLCRAHSQRLGREGVDRHRLVLADAMGTIGTLAAGGRYISLAKTHA